MENHSEHSGRGGRRLNAGPTEGERLGEASSLGTGSRRRGKGLGFHAVAASFGGGFHWPAVGVVCRGRVGSAAGREQQLLWFHRGWGGGGARTQASGPAGLSGRRAASREVGGEGEGGAGAGSGAEGSLGKWGSGQTVQPCDPNQELIPARDGSRRRALLGGQP